MNIFVQLAGGKVVTAFTCPQDNKYWPGLVEIEESDYRYLSFLSAMSPKSNPLFLRDQLLSVAALRIAPLQDAIDLNTATEDEVILLKKWKEYRVELNRIQDQAGYPDSIDWTEPPA